MRAGEDRSMGHSGTRTVLFILSEIGGLERVSAEDGYDVAYVL